MRAVAELRARAGGLVAAAAIATSFFGGQALRRHVHPTSWLAIACFVCLSVAVLAILRPRHDCQFNLSPAGFINIYLEPPDADPLPISDIHRDLALHMGRSADRNRDQLRWLMIAFRIGAILLVLETIFLGGSADQSVVDCKPWRASPHHNLSPSPSARARWSARRVAKVAAPRAAEPIPTPPAARRLATQRGRGGDRGRSAVLSEVS